MLSRFYHACFTYQTGYYACMAGGQAVIDSAGFFSCGRACMLWKTFPGASTVAYCFQKQSGHSEGVIFNGETQKGGGWWEFPSR